MKKIVISCIKGYQNYFSGGKSFAACAFQPTCSSYAIEALEIHGFFKGTILAFRRLSQCRPGGKHAGYDPVPEKGTWNNNLDTRKK